MRSENENISTAKESVRNCPGTSPPYICCDYKVIDAVEGCIYGCDYCILRSYLKGSTIKFNLYMERMVYRIREMCEGSKNLVRFGTGELSDSLALPHLNEFNLNLMKEILKIPNAILEFKTKSTNVDFLPPCPEKRVVISWSLNSEEIASRLEKKSPPVQERLKSAKKVVDKGYIIGFHFDPIIYYQNWKDGYRKIAEDILNNIPEESIAWVSMGGLRFPFYSREIYFETLRGHLREMVKCSDGKMRYNFFLRREMYLNIIEVLKGADIFLYLCMESPKIWKHTLGYVPESSCSLSENFSNFFKRKFLK